MTFVNISSNPGRFSYGPGETLIFSVTNKKVYNYVGKSGKPVTVSFIKGDWYAIVFSEGNAIWGLDFETNGILRNGLSIS